MKLLSVYTTLALTAACLGTIGTAQAETSAWTGCITPGGTIIHMAQGDAPLKACSKNQQLVHLNDVAAFQHTEANYDQAKICAVFHSLFVAPSMLEDLGCSSTPTLTRPGTVMHIEARNYRNNAAAGNEDVCGIFDIEPSGEHSFRSIVKKGYVASTSVIPITGAIDVCQEKCADDDKCVAAYFRSESPNSVAFQVGTCRTFHYSDSLSVDWDHYCGFAEDGPFSCISDLSSVFNNWFVRVPDGQVLNNCPGAVPTP